MVAKDNRRTSGDIVTHDVGPLGKEDGTPREKSRVAGTNPPAASRVRLFSASPPAVPSSPDSAFATATDVQFGIPIDKSAEWHRSSELSQYDAVRRAVEPSTDDQEVVTTGVDAAGAWTWTDGRSRSTRREQVD